MDVPLETEIDQADITDTEFKADSGFLRLNYDQVDTIIWAIGYKGNFNYINIPGLLDAKKQPIHINGVAPIDKFYYIGFPWLITRKSGIIYGVQEDSRQNFALIKESVS